MKREITRAVNRPFLAPFSALFFWGVRSDPSATGFSERPLRISLRRGHDPAITQAAAWLHIIFVNFVVLPCRFRHVTCDVGNRHSLSRRPIDRPKTGQKRCVDLHPCASLGSPSIICSLQFAAFLSSTQSKFSNPQPPTAWRGRKTAILV